MRETVDRYTKTVLVFLMGILVVDVIWQVFTRYILQSPSTFTDELARFLLIWVSLLGAAYASGKKMHLAIDLLPNKLEGESRRKLDILINGLIIAFALSVMVLGGVLLVNFTMHQPSPALNIPMGIVYTVVPLSGLLISYYKINEITTLLQTEAEPEKVN